MFILSISFFFTSLLWNEKFFFLFQKKESLDEFIKLVIKNSRPKQTLDFSSIYFGHHQLELLHPVFNMRSVKFQQLETVCENLEAPSIGSFGEKQPTKFVQAASNVEGDRKQSQINAYLMEGIPLVEDFISRPPFIDENGSSYAFKLVSYEIPPFNKRQWIEKNLSFFKVSELSEVLNRFQIDHPVFSIISMLNEKEMELVIKGENLILTSKYLLIRDQSELGFSPLRYLAYERMQTAELLKSSDFELMSYEPSLICFEKVGNLCWGLSSKKTISYLYKYSKIFMMVLGLVLIIFFFSYIRQLADKKRNEKLKRLSLQVLTHEFRTPVSSLVLASEQLSKSIQNLNNQDQDLITTISADIFKLQRIVEISQCYLQSTNGKIQFNQHKLESLNNWVSEFMLTYWPRVKVELLDIDQRAVTDVFWLKFILNSLLENAINHGKPPVVLKLESGGKGISFIIEDAGVCNFEHLREMTQPFVKSTKSNGMGLGLNIVDFIIKEWGHSLLFKNNPTCFTLLLKEKV